VKTVLYPAIALMNRLSFGMKFSLISVLFFLPMLVTNFYLVRDSYNEFVGTRAELQSLDLMSASLKLRADLENLNDMVEINAAVGQSGKIGDLEARIGALTKRIEADLAKLEPVVTDAEQIELFTSKRDELEKALKAADAETSLRELTIEGLLAIQAGDNPRVVADKLEAFVPPEERRAAAAAEPPAGKGKAEPQAEPVKAAA